MEFLRSLLRRRFARVHVATSRKVGCFLRLKSGALRQKIVGSLGLHRFTRGFHFPSIAWALSRASLEAMGSTVKILGLLIPHPFRTLEADLCRRPIHPGGAIVRD